MLGLPYFITTCYNASRMKQFQEKDASGHARSCAALVMETVPLVMSVLRAEMRARRPEDISIPQFRTLIFLSHHAGDSLSEVAEHLGLTLSTTSKLIDGLVKRALVTRTIAAEDRRRIELALTEQGAHSLQAVRTGAQARMEETLSTLTPEEQTAVELAMRALRGRFRGGSSAGDADDEEAPCPSWN